MTSSEPLMIGIAGALGRMGRTVAALVDGRDDMAVAALYDRPGTVGQTVGSRTLEDLEAALEASQVVVDFTTPEASVALARAAARAGAPALVIGSTGFSEAQSAELAEAAKRVAIVKSGNYSLGVNLLLGLVEKAAATLSPEDFDIEVFEAHHKRKVDSPSGTALMLGQAAARGRGVDLADAAVRVRDGLNGPRPDGAIGFSVMRGGGIVGEHSVAFVGEEEIITLSHSARDRGLFARGAVRAARWVAERPPGLYDMLDVLGVR